MIAIKRYQGHVLVNTAALAGILMAGCETNDERFVELAQEADNRQAEQNREIARQNQELAEATNTLIEADARSRQELVSLERELQEERSVIGHERDELEDERRQIAKDRRWDSETGQAVGGGAVLLAVLLPLIICGYVLHHMANDNPDEAIGEILTAEIVSDDPVFVPPPDELQRLDGPKGPKEETQ